MKRFLLVIFTAVVLSVYVVYPREDTRSSSLVTIEGESYYVHTVSKGETLYSLSHLYSVGEDDIKKNNPQVIGGLQEGTVLKIPAIFKEEKLSKRKQSRLFDKHTVNQGETLYSISRRYEIPVSTLIEDNEGLDPANLSIGQKINIRKKSMGDATDKQIDEQMQKYRDAINSVSTDVIYHLVEKGETIYGLALHYGVSKDDIISANDLLPGGLKSGAMIKIPVVGEVKIAAKENLITSSGHEVELKEVVDTNLLWSSRETLSTKVKDISTKELVNVALLLPLKNENENDKANENFLDFYRGVLLGMEDLKAEGVSARLSLYNTSRSNKEISGIVNDPLFATTDIIIGPVYEDNLRSVLEFAEKNGTAVVSPLAILERTASPVLYQMSPDPANKYDMLKQMLSGDKNIIYVTSQFPDEEIDNEVKPILPRGYKTVNYVKGMRPDVIAGAINKRGDNIIVVSCADEMVADQILATISSMHNNLIARSMSFADIRIVGSNKWSRFRKSIDKNLYFKLKFTYVALYHADRGDERIRNVDSRYISAFETFPTLYSYRGYDAAKLFVGSAMEKGNDYISKLNSGKQVLLQTPYHFISKEVIFTEDPLVKGMSNINGAWALVCYNNDYSIEVKSNFSTSPIETYQTNPSTSE